MRDDGLEAMVASLADRLNRLERESVHVRMANVITASTREVSVGGGASQVGVTTLDPLIQNGDVVEALVGNGLVVALGRLGIAASVGATTLTGTGTTSATVNVNHGLQNAAGTSITPRVVLVTPNNDFINASTSAYSTTQFTLSNRQINATNYSNAIINRWLALA